MSFFLRICLITIVFLHVLDYYVLQDLWRLIYQHLNQAD
jgi:hypothetical protein